MFARYVQKGDAVDYRPTEAVAAGDVVVIADLIGIARLDIEAGTLGSLAVVGVFDVVKTADAVLPGSTVYWDADAKSATLVSGSNHYLGKAIAAATPEDDSVRVLLNAADSIGGGSSAQTIADLIDNSGGAASDTVPATDMGSRDAIASVVAKTNAILAALRAVGIVTGQ